MPGFGPCTYGREAILCAQNLEDPSKRDCLDYLPSDVFASCKTFVCSSCEQSPESQSWQEFQEVSFLCPGIQGAEMTNPSAWVIADPIFVRHSGVEVLIVPR